MVYLMSPVHSKVFHFMMSGYDINLFLDDNSSYFQVLIKEFTCSICLQIAKNAVNLSYGCDHVFCSACLAQHLTRSQLCPVCRSDSNGLTRVCGIARRILNQAPVRCSNLHEGCDWTGQLGSLEEHLDKRCVEAMIKCKFDPDHTMKRKHQDKHHANCSKRDVECKTCSKMISHHVFTDHCSNRCPERYHLLSKRMQGRC